MTDKDALGQAEEILLNMDRELQAETIKAHSEMVLLTALMSKPIVQAQLLFKGSRQGPDYMTGMAIAIGLTARNWGRTLADDSNFDFVQYISAESEDTCEGVGRYAHRFVEEILKIQDASDADKVRGEMRTWHDEHAPREWGRMFTHLVYLCAELVATVMEARNGDWDGSDDR